MRTRRVPSAHSVPEGLRNLLIGSRGTQDGPWAPGCSDKQQNHLRTDDKHRSPDRLLSHRP